MCFIILFLILVVSGVVANANVLYLCISCHYVVIVYIIKDAKIGKFLNHLNSLGRIVEGKEIPERAVKERLYRLNIKTCENVLIIAGVLCQNNALVISAVRQSTTVINILVVTCVIFVICVVVYDIVCTTSGCKKKCAC